MNKKTDSGRKTTSSLLERLLFSDADELFGLFRFLLLFIPIVLWSFFAIFVFDLPPSFSGVALFFLRYMSLPLLGVGVSFVAASNYFRDIYEIDDFGVAVSFLFSVLFGMHSISLKIPNEDGDLEKDHMFFNIGGPGSLDIQDGHIVVLEELSKPSDVCGSGARRITRYQRVREVYDLCDKIGHIDQITTITKNGIEVGIKDINYRFRFLSIIDRKSDRAKTNPYTFSVRAAINLTYKRAVGKSGRPASWEDSVKGTIRSAIVKHIKRLSVDELIVSVHERESPLQSIYSVLNSPQLRGRLKDLGAELLWCDVGKLDLGELDAIEYLRRKWIAEWDGRIGVIRAQSNAELLANQERGRAEGQVGLLQSVSRALQEAHLGGDQVDIDRNLRKIVLARTAQVIEALTSVYENGSESVQGKVSDE